jgi:primosomal protein N''
MSKVIQVKISRTEMEKIVKKYINERVIEICKKQKIDDQIFFEVEQAVVEVKVPNYEERLAAIEFALEKLKVKK